MSSMSYSLRPLRSCPVLIDSCAKLLKSIWPHTKTERLQHLENEKCSGLPYSLVLIEHQENVADLVIGHVRVVQVVYPDPHTSVYLEAGCIDTTRQGLGLAKKLMQMAEQHVVDNLGCRQIFVMCFDHTKSKLEHISYQEYPVATLKTIGGNILGQFDPFCSWHGNAPLPGWEFAYEGPIATKDYMQNRANGINAMVKWMS